MFFCMHYFYIIYYTIPTVNPRNPHMRANSHTHTCSLIPIRDYCTFSAIVWHVWLLTTKGDRYRGAIY